MLCKLTITSKTESNYLLNIHTCKERAAASKIVITMVGGDKLPFEYLPVCNIDGSFQVKKLPIFLK